MYKTRITQWGLIKNYRATEKQYAVGVIKEHHGSGMGVRSLYLRNALPPEPSSEAKILNRLMRTQLLDVAWGYWMGLDHDIVAASCFAHWKQRLCIEESKRTLPNPCSPSMTENGGAVLTSKEPVELPSAEEAKCDLTELAKQFAVDAAHEKPDIVESTDCEGIDGNTCSTQEGSTRHFVAIKSLPDVRQPLATTLSPFEPECEPTTSLVSSPRSSTDEGLSQRGTPSSSDLSSEVSVQICTNRRGRHVVQRIMAEFNTMFFGSPSGSVRRQTEGSESTSSDHVAKDCSSSDQVSQDCSAIRAGKKRAHVRDLSCDDEDDGNQKRRKKLNSMNSTVPQARLLACPFNKHDSKIYGPYNDDKALARKFKRCGGPGWDVIPRLK